MADDERSWKVWCPPGYIPVSEIARTVRQWFLEGRRFGYELRDLKTLGPENIRGDDDFPNPVVMGPEFISGRLRAAAVVVTSGQLIEIKPSEWRRQVPFAPRQIATVSAACLGQMIWVRIGSGDKQCWAIVAEHDLAMRLGHTDAPPLPAEMPAEWLESDASPNLAPAAEASDISCETAFQTKRGRPPSHDWEEFWIQVAIYAARDDLKLEHRRELQTHMMKWTAEHWQNAPDQATVRSRLARLFKAVTDTGN